MKKDYSGVATHRLAEYLSKIVDMERKKDKNFSMETWAESLGISFSDVYTILSCRNKLTGLDKVDRICLFSGDNLSQLFHVIPMNKQGAKLMATDELIVSLCVDEDETDVLPFTKEDIEHRAAELWQLRLDELADREKVT